MMPAWLFSAIRTGVQALVGYLVAWLASHGLNMPVEAQNWLIQVIMVSVVIAAWTALVRWLETRTGNGLWSWLARKTASVLMFGLDQRQPVYLTPGQARQSEPPRRVSII